MIDYINSLSKSKMHLYDLVDVFLRLMDYANFLLNIVEC